MNFEDVDFDVESEKWSPLIGKFILIFGDIERTIQYVIFNHLIGSFITENDLSAHFEKKIDLFERILRKRYAEDRLSNKLSLVVDSIRKLKTTRNLLAHNGLSLSFKEDSSGEFRLVQFEVISHKENAGINLKDLGDKLKELEHCRTLLSELLMPFYDAQSNS